jgi:hypothetical protein
MLSRLEAQAQLQSVYSTAVIKAWTQYHDLYLFRVEHPSIAERDWDPFFSVDPITGEVRDFSVLTDAKPDEISKLEWHDI